MTNIPDGLPTLSRRAHEPGDGKACLMEYISVIAGEPWSDNPQCVNDALVQWGRALNDLTRQKNRHVFVPLIGRLMGTGAAYNFPHVTYALDRFGYDWWGFSGGGGKRALIRLILKVSLASPKKKARFL